MNWFLRWWEIKELLSEIDYGLAIAYSKLEIDKNL